MRLMTCTWCIFLILTILSIILYLYLIVTQIKSHLYKVQSSTSYKKYDDVNYDDNFNGVNDVKYDNDASANDIKLFRSRLIVDLRKSEFEKSNLLFQNNFENLYNVKFKGIKGSKLPNKKLLCDIDFQTIENINDLSMNKIHSKSFSSNDDSDCALVSSAGAMTGSKLGNDIDSHSIVMRFNDAPTESYEQDVGNKTTIRILNSQLVLNDSFKLTESVIFQNADKFVWDVLDYDLNLKNWKIKRKNFFDLFQNANNIFPDKKLQLIHPSVIWKLWDVLQTSTHSTLPKTPPSSGFIGLLYLMKMCTTIDIYEYIPSIRVTNKCHYYDDTQNKGCTFGDWHPLATEKLFVLAINEGNGFDQVIKGKVTIKGC